MHGAGLVLAQHTQALFGSLHVADGHQEDEAVDEGLQIPVRSHGFHRVDVGVGEGGHERRTHDLLPAMELALLQNVVE